MIRLRAIIATQTPSRRGWLDPEELGQPLRRQRSNSLPALACGQSVLKSGDSFAAPTRQSETDSPEFAGSADAEIVVDGVREGLPVLREGGF